MVMFGRCSSMGESLQMETEMLVLLKLYGHQYLILASLVLLFPEMSLLLSGQTVSLAIHVSSVLLCRLFML